jgi:hypothetical protein
LGQQAGLSTTDGIMFAEPSMPERRPSPGLQLNLSSNNPFRRAASPGYPSPGFPSPASATNRSSSGSRPMSRNPFITTFEAEFNKEASRDLDMSATMKDSPKKSTFGTATEDLFVRSLCAFAAQLPLS